MPKSLIVGLKSLTPIRNTAVRPSGFGRWASKRSRSDPSVTDYLLETLRMLFAAGGELTNLECDVLHKVYP
jgi:hypothetical protein